MYESFFIFDGKFNGHCDGVALDSPLRSTPPNVFMCHFQIISLKLIVYRQFVDDTFLLFWIN